VNGTLKIANNRLMGDLRNRWWQNLLGGIGFLAILATSGLLVAKLTGVAG
jgi:Mn2+/Fe2+ NRAMP family transporter